MPDGQDVPPRRQPSLADVFCGLVWRSGTPLLRYSASLHSSATPPPTHQTSPQNTPPALRPCPLLSDRGLSARRRQHTAPKTAIPGRCSLQAAPALQRSGIPALQPSVPPWWSRLFRKLHRLLHHSSTPRFHTSTPAHFRASAPCKLPPPTLPSLAPKTRFKAKKNSAEGAVFAR